MGQNQKVAKAGMRIAEHAGCRMENRWLDLQAFSDNLNPFLGQAVAEEQRFTM